MWSCALEEVGPATSDGVVRKDLSETWCDEEGKKWPVSLMQVIHNGTYSDRREHEGSRNVVLEHSHYLTLIECKFGCNVITATGFVNTWTCLGESGGPQGKEHLNWDLSQS